MRRHDKAWAIHVFSSANVLNKYTMDELIGLGISWVWMGMEGKNSQYAKLRGVDVRRLVKRLQAHGIRVLGSTIIGLENHTAENIDEAIDYAVGYNTDFHQFMLYTPIPGTPLHDELTAKGLMKDPSEYEMGDIHGQLVFNYRHPHIKDGLEGEFMTRAFDRDFEVNGPSTVRIVRTTLAGWRRHKNHPDPRVRRRMAWEARDLGTTYAALVGAARRYYRNDPVMRGKIEALLTDLYAEFGWKARLYASVGGWYVLRKIRAEAKRLSRGWTYEPPTFYERNEHCADRPELPECRCCTPLEATATVRPRTAAEAPATVAASRLGVAEKDSVLVD